MNLQSGRGWAYASLFLMGGLSIAGNIAHTFMVVKSPDALDIILAGGWPVGLFLAIEMFARLPWRAAASHRIVRYGGLTLVAVLTGVVSYNHLNGLLSARGQGGLVSVIGPLAVDGIMAMATMGLVLTRVASVSLVSDSDVDDAIDRLELVLADQMHADAALLELPSIEDIAPVSPAPLPTPSLNGGSTRRPRGTWDARRVAELAIDGRKAAQISAELSVPSATAARFVRVAKMLRENPAVEIPRTEKVHPEHVQIMRSLVGR